MKRINLYKHYKPRGGSPSIGAIDDDEQYYFCVSVRLGLYWPVAETIDHLVANQIHLRIHKASDPFLFKIND